MLLEVFSDTLDFPQPVASARGLPAKSKNCTFPKTKDPAAGLKKIDSRLEIVRSEQSTLSLELLNLGFEGLKLEQKRLWLADIESGAFKVQLVE
jgi:hypothetical protein